MYLCVRILRVGFESQSKMSLVSPGIGVFLHQVSLYSCHIVEQNVKIADF